jgi:hypothetical protein
MCSRAKKKVCLESSDKCKWIVGKGCRKNAKICSLPKSRKRLDKKRLHIASYFINDNYLSDYPHLIERGISDVLKKPKKDVDMAKYLDKFQNNTTFRTKVVHAILRNVDKDYVDKQYEYFTERY